MRSPARLSSDRGALGVDVLAIGVLLFVVVTLLIMSTWAVVDGKIAATAAAREAARAYVEAPGPEAAPGAAHAAANATLLGHGRPTERMTLDLSLGEPFGRCNRVVVRTEYAVPVVANLPWIGGFGRASIPVSGTASEIVDPFRSGLAIEDPEQGAVRGECQ